VVLIRRNWRLGPLLVHIAALAPAAALAWHYGQGLLPDPVQAIVSRTGRTALVLLLASLACAPSYALTGWTALLRFRRTLGLYASLYAGGHALAYVGLDYGLDWDLLLEALQKQRHILPGALALVLLLTLSLTSTDYWRTRLGRRWKKLHRLVYLAGALAMAHVLWMGKSAHVSYPYATVLGLLLVLRIWAMVADGSARRGEAESPARH